MDSIKKALELTGQAIVNKMVETLNKNKNNKTGKLVNSIDYSINNNTIEISMEDYGVSVDEGIDRGPGKIPPVKPIAEWIRTKNIKVPQNLTVEEFAFIIARKIGKKGQKNRKPSPFILPSIEYVVNSYLPEVMETALVDEITKQFNKK